jgi:2-methylcitrate dehydratase PrpD
MATTTTTRSSHTSTLATFTSQLKYSDLPEHTIARTEDLFADWLFCGIAGASYRPVVAFEDFARAQGGDGNGELIKGGKGLKPYWASFINGGAGHVVEQDDVHK